MSFCERIHRKDMLGKLIFCRRRSHLINYHRLSYEVEDEDLCALRCLQERKYKKHTTQYGTRQFDNKINIIHCFQLIVWTDINSHLFLSCWLWLFYGLRKGKMMRRHAIPYRENEINYGSENVPASRCSYNTKFETMTNERN